MLLLLGDGADADGADDGEGDAGPLARVEAFAEAGADTFVAGSAIFGSDDYATTIATMRQELAAAAG